jgi:hypothetical protein
MILALVPKDYQARDLNSAYKLRSRFWATSICAHIVWVAIMVRIPLSSPSRRPIYDQFIRPMESKTLVYRPPKKTAPAAPEKRVGQTPDPRGRIFSPRTVIATAPQAKSQKQIISTPVKLPDVKMDVPAPDIVARLETALPPPPPKAASKQFTAPPSQRAPKLVAQTEIAANLNLPQIRTTGEVPPEVARIGTTLPPPPKIAPKQFIPPPSQRAPKLAARTEIAEANLPQVITGGPAPPTTARIGTSLPPPPKVAPKQFTPPVASERQQKQIATVEIAAALPATTVAGGQNTPVVPSTTFSRLPGPPKPLPPAPPAAGNEQANIAVASINPAAGKQLPNRSRAGEFSVAPVTGEPSSGAAAPGALTVPNLTVREPAPAKAQPAKSQTVVYAEKVRASSTTTFAVPLRPANRSIPRAVDARFPGRSVYAVVIPIENLPAYGGDWILWFAEATPEPGQTPSVRAPIPYRKIEMLEQSREAKDSRLQISATLGVDGKLTDVKVLSPVSAAVQAIAVEDLSSWEWKPATRNSVPIAIETVFEISFRLPQRP